jgi:hypothetical protein
MKKSPAEKAARSIPCPHGGGGNKFFYYQIVTVDNEIHPL